MSLPSTDPASTGGRRNARPGHRHVLYRDGAGNLHLDWPRERMAEAVADREGLLWVDFQARR